MRVCAAVAALACLLPGSAWGSSLRQRLSAALAGYHGAGTGAIAVDLTTGKVVFAHNAGASFVPASNEKLALTYAALVVLGPTFRMRTELLGEGHLRDDVVWEGDLVLRGYGDPTLDRDGLLALAGDLRESGIRRVTGGLIADESFFDAHRAGPGWKSYFVPGESSPLSALSIGGADALATAKAMRAALRAAGVRVQGPTRRARAGGWPLADGSGLSSLDRMTPKGLVTILQRAWSDPDIGPLLAGCLPVAGREGTLRHRMRAAPARGSVRAKTGTLTNASALSGFVRDRYAFAILQNGSRLGAAHEAQDRFAAVLAAQ